MRFNVSHTTHYQYAAPASESFAELRVWPPDTPAQKIRQRELIIEPNVPVDHYLDYFGNQVEFFSVPFRHNELSVKASAEVDTFPCPPDEAQLEISVGEARQIFNSAMVRLFEFLQPTELAPIHPVGNLAEREFFRAAEPLGPALLRLNEWIFQNFKYQPGATEIATPLAEVIQHRQGVCQDFAHLMLAILRANGLPARYVSGYIEAFDPETTAPELIGAAASHAWVEVLLPGGFWWGLDPTNHQPTGERHVKVATGRDYNDVAPMRGAYKGVGDQRLQVMVELTRNPHPPTA